MLWKSHRPRIQKRSLLLLEVVLCLALLTFALFPLVEAHVGIAREEQRQLRAMQLVQQGQAAFCLLKIRLHEHVYSWEQLMRGFSYEQLTVEKIDQSTKRKRPESGLLLLVTYHLGSQTFERMCYVEKARDHTR